MHSLNLRNYIVKNGYFTELYHFNETPIFEKATVSTLIFKYIKSKPNRNQKIAVVKYYANRKLTAQIIENIKNKIPDEKTEVFQAKQFEKTNAGY